MTFLTRAIAIAALSLPFGAPVLAESFKTVTDKSEFVDLIDGRQLTSLGIRLSVSPAAR